MKIKAEKWIIDDSMSYKILDIERCCDKLINSKNISINTEYDEYETFVDDNPEYSVKITREEYDYENYPKFYYETIKFCPWCGKPIVIEIINEVDKTDEYKLLEKQREELWEKCHKTDSKKKELSLKEQVRKLDDKINNMLMNDDFGKESD